MVESCKSSVFKPPSVRVPDTEDIAGGAGGGGVGAGGMGGSHADAVVVKVYEVPSYVTYSSLLMNMVTDCSFSALYVKPVRSVPVYSAFTEPELNTTMSSHVVRSGHVVDTALAPAISAHHVTTRAKQTLRNDRRE